MQKPPPRPRVRQVLCKYMHVHCIIMRISLIQCAMCALSRSWLILVLYVFLIQVLGLCLFIC